MDDNPTGNVSDAQTADPSEEVQSTSTGDVKTEDWKESQTVPYSRFEQVIRQNQEYKNDISKQISDISEKLAQLDRPKSTEGLDENSWDAKVQQAKNWDEFVGWIKDDVRNDIKSEQQEAEKKAEKELDQEVKYLYDSGLVTSKSDENKVIEFALKKGEELGKPIPLHVAYQWMKETSKPEGEEYKGASKNIQSSAKSKGGPEKSKDSYKSIHGKDLDELVMEAKENTPTA